MKVVPGKRFVRLQMVEFTTIVLALALPLTSIPQAWLGFSVCQTNFPHNISYTAALIYRQPHNTDLSLSLHVQQKWQIELTCDHQGVLFLQLSCSQPFGYPLA